MEIVLVTSRHTLLRQLPRNYIQNMHKFLHQFTFSFYTEEESVHAVHVMK